MIRSAASITPVADLFHLLSTQSPYDYRVREATALFLVFRVRDLVLVLRAAVFLVGADVALGRDRPIVSRVLEFDLTTPGPTIAGAITACAAAKRATGTRNGLHET